jgi:hypothetical protein
MPEHRSIVTSSQPKSWARALVAVAALAAGGCAAVRTQDGERLALTSPDFRAYVERVFRRQNQVATDVELALEDLPAGEPSAKTLQAADDGLQSACAGVNELATARRDAVKLGLRRQAAAARTVPQCEAAAQSAAAALQAAGR